MIRRRTRPHRWDDRLSLWLVVGLNLLGWGGGMLLDWATPLEVASAFYRMTTWPFSLLPLPVVGLLLLTGAGAVAVSCSAWGSEAVAFRCRVYALCWLMLVGLWYGASGFVYGAMQVAVLLGVALASWRWQPRGGAPWKA